MQGPEEIVQEFSFQGKWLGLVLQDQTELKNASPLTWNLLQQLQQAQYFESLQIRICSHWRAIVTQEGSLA